MVTISTRIIVTGVSFGWLLAVATPDLAAHGEQELGRHPSPALALPTVSPSPVRTAAPMDRDAAAPDGGILAVLFPAAVSAPAPAWVKQGTRLTYYGASATVRGSYYDYAPDPNGGFVDSHGNRYGQRESQGGSGQGYVQFDVTRLTPTTAVFDERMYLLTPGSAPRLTTQMAAVTPAGVAGELSINPTVLASMADMRRDGLQILHMPFSTGGRQYRAVRVQSNTAQGYQAWVFDTASGILLYSGSSTKGPQPQYVGPGTSDGATMLTETFLVSSRSMDLPWADAAAPEWLARTTSLQYTGSVGVTMAGSMPMQIPVSVSYRLTARGSNWARFSATQVTSMPGAYPGAPPATETSDRVSGPAQIGGVWMAPEALASLRPGQVIDRDPVTGMTTSVGQMLRGATGGAMVAIIQTSPVQQCELRYDVATGVLLQVAQSQMVGGVRMVVQVRLTRRD